MEYDRKFLINNEVAHILTAVKDKGIVSSPN